MSVYTSRVTQTHSPLFAPISVSASGNNTVIAGVAGMQIRVLAYNIVAASAVTVTWASSVAGAISGPKALAANGGISVAYCPPGCGVS